MTLPYTEFKISGGNKSAEYKLEKTEKDGILYLDIYMTLPKAEIPEQFSIEWVHEGGDCLSLWNCGDRIHRIMADWAMTDCDSRLASGMPIQQLVSFSGKNKLCVAVSDVDNPIRIGMGWIEETASVLCRIDFFTLPTNMKRSYHAAVRLDTRSISFYDSIYDVSDWWEQECGYACAYVPDCARQPMDSLWYSFHQNLNFDSIINECKLSSALGMESVIIDDGWQTDDSNRGYAYCGDWEASENKVGDMAKLVSEIHKLGMKVIVWYSVPFVGVKSKKYNEFKDCLLEDCGNGEGSFALDPRYQKVREFLVSTYEAAVKKWDLDGLKLDFIDSFQLKGKALEYDGRRDYQSLEDAVHALMSEIKARLTAIKPDIMIEFRQTYVGPSIRKYGNMLRVGDCPGDIITNRSQIVNLRLTSGKTAVHSDMIMWNEQDTVENAALQFASVIFSVPQISMVIERLPAEHVKMLKFYIDFWKSHRDVLLDGKLTADNPECDYSRARSVLGNREVIAAYMNPVIEVLADECVGVNASCESGLIIKTARDMAYRVVNCMGEELFSGKVTAGISEIDVPAAGMVFLK